MVAEQSLVTDFARTRSRDAAFGHCTSASSAGQAVGPAALAVFGGQQVQPATGALFFASTVLVVAIAVAGTGLGVGQPLTMSGVTLLAPAPQRATAVSLRLTGNRLGQALVAPDPGAP